MCGNYDCRFGPFVAQQTQYAQYARMFRVFLALINGNNGNVTMGLGFHFGHRDRFPNTPAGEAEGHAELQGKQEELLGNKGANLAEMASIGLPVPPGFTLTTEAHRERYLELSWEKLETTDRL